ncbi:hypothetical protein TNCV_446631 [Trichonephila clavipes]|nr:hypothetical protein TNCV_446631 [Trichonephila clavipes]
MLKLLRFDIFELQETKLPEGLILLRMNVQDTCKRNGYYFKERDSPEGKMDTKDVSSEMDNGMRSGDCGGLRTGSPYPINESETMDRTGTDFWAIFVFSQRGMWLCRVWVLFMGHPVFISHVPPTSSEP